jgi:ankyrin repeat protein
VARLGWATCFRQVREEVAEYLLSHGATLNLWSAIALDRIDDVRAMVTRDPALPVTRMTRNHHRRTPPAHAAARNRLPIVQLLLELGADPNATDATGATALTTAAQDNADPAIGSVLLTAGGRLDFLTAVNLGHYGAADGDAAR